MRFVWISDVHIDNALWSALGAEDPLDIAAYIDSLGAEFVIDTGDLVATCATLSFQQYMATIGSVTTPLYAIVGNHDECGGGCIFSPDTCLVDFESIVNDEHALLFTRDGYKFIGITTLFNPPDKGRVTAAELAYLEAELQTAGEAIPLVFGHHPIGEITDGAPALLALFSTYDVGAYFTGHLHKPLSVFWQDGTYHVNGDQVLPVTPTDCGMMICDVSDRGIVIEYIRAASPWDSYYKRDVPCGVSSGNLCFQRLALL